MNALKWLLDAVFPPRPTERMVDTAAPEELYRLVNPLPIETRGLSSIALLPYRSPLVQAVIQEAKFHAHTRALYLLGKVLKEYLLELSSEEAGLADCIVVLPIPLSSARKQERGHNQVEQVCRNALKGNTEILFDVTILTRVRDTLPQTTLTRERRLENMRGAFFATMVDPSATYVVIDDVTTTGATLQDAARALTEAGAVHIIPLALAH